MRHTLAYDIIGYCQICQEALTSRDVLETSQARVCPECFRTVNAGHLDLEPKASRYPDAG